MKIKIFIFLLILISIKAFTQNNTNIDYEQEYKLLVNAYNNLENEKIKLELIIDNYNTSFKLVNEKIDILKWTINILITIFLAILGGYGFFSFKNSKNEIKILTKDFQSKYNDFQNEISDDFSKLDLKQYNLISDHHKTNKEIIDNEFKSFSNKIHEVKKTLIDKIDSIESSIDKINYEEVKRKGVERTIINYATELIMKTNRDWEINGYLSDILNSLNRISTFSKFDHADLCRRLYSLGDEYEITVTKILERMKELELD